MCGSLVSSALAVGQVPASYDSRQTMSLLSMWSAYLARLNIIRSKALLEGAALRTPIAVAQILKRRPTCRVLLSLHDLSVYLTCMLHDTHAAAGVLRLMSKICAPREKSCSW